MRTLLLLFLILGIVIPASAQKVQVVELGTNKAVAFALVFNSDTSKSITSDADGYFELEDFKGEQWIYVQHLSFQTKKVYLADLNEEKTLIPMNAKIKLFDPVIVSASLFEESLRKRGERIEIIGLKTISASTAATAADLVQSSGMVSVQKTQAGGGSPIIRSFEANKILLMIDGVRMNNAIYRGGHLQNSITIDPQMLHSVEVLFGPGAVVYGSDAMGGVIHFTSRKPMLKDSGIASFSANARARLATVSSEESGHIDFSFRGEKLASLTSLSYSSYGDLQQGRIRNSEIGNLGRRTFYVKRINSTDSVIFNPDPEIQIGTGYNQLDFGQKILFERNSTNEHLLNLQISNSSNIPRYDRLVQLRDSLPRYAEWSYGPQQRLMLAYDYSQSDSNSFFGQKRIVLSMQRIEESRISRSFNSNIQNSREEALWIAGASINLAHQYQKGVFRLGADAYQNYLKSKATAKDIESHTSTPTSTRYPDGGSQMLFSGAYASIQQKLKANWQLNSGLRVSYTNASATINEAGIYPFINGKLKNEHFAINGNASLKYLYNENGSLSFRVSSGFRSPNIDDLSKVFESIPSSVVIPNPDLTPEKIYNAEINIRLPIGKSNLIWTSVYYNWLSDLITRVPGKHLGRDSLIFDGTMSAILQNQNAQKAYVYGIAIGIQSHYNRSLNYTASLNYQYGRIKTDSIDYPLDHVPPLYGKIMLSYESHPILLNIYSFFNATKRLEDYNLFGADKYNSANRSGLPSWFTINTQLAYSINSELDLELSLENILDTNYRSFASAISAPGRNFIFSVRMKI